MTFNEEMDRFFKGFPIEHRKIVEQNFFYRQAAAKEDAVKASEIANEIIVGWADDRGCVFQPLKVFKKKKSDGGA